MTRLRPGSRAARCLAALVVGCSGLLVVPAAPAAAHPLGDFTVNTHIGVRVEPAAVALEVVLDIAEVPALRAFPALDGGSGEAVPAAEQRAYRDRLCPALLASVAVRLGSRPVALELVDSALSFPPGDAGLSTARLECSLRSSASLDPVGSELAVTDSTAVQPVGWREMTAVGDGVELAGSTVPARSPSQVLRSYPQDSLDDPLDQREARLTVVAGSGVVAGRTAGTATEVPPAAAPTTLAGRLSELMGARELGIGSGLVAVALAVLLGSLHAVAPGHGKTLMAAYLVGRSGTVRQAAVIGASVTVTHTAGVLVLGVLVSAAVVGAPERVYAWLGLASGLLVIGIGVALLRSGWRRLDAGSDHHHDHGHGHGHGYDHGVRAASPPGATGRTGGATLTALREPAQHHAHPVPRQRTGHLRSTLTVGFAGGLVPSPSALVVLLGGISLGRAWFGVLLVLAYGIGMALALVGTGLLLVRARDVTERWVRRREGRAASSVPALVRALPLVTAGLVVAVGTVVTGQGLLRL